MLVLWPLFDEHETGQPNFHNAYIQSYKHRLISEIGVSSAGDSSIVAANELDGDPKAQIVEATKDLNLRIQCLVDFAPILDQDLALLDLSERKVSSEEPEEFASAKKLQSRPSEFVNDISPMANVVPSGSLPQMYYCRHDGCVSQASFYWEKDRNRHEARHQIFWLCSRELCDRRFNQEENLEDHIRRVHGHLRSNAEQELQKYFCQQCSACFHVEEEDLLSHLRIHAGGSRLASSASSDYFKGHELGHGVEDAFVCQGKLEAGPVWGCGRSFSHIGGLARHLRDSRRCLGPLMELADLAQDENRFTVPAAILNQYPTLSKFC